MPRQRDNRGPRCKPNVVFAVGRAAHIRVFTTKTSFSTYMRIVTASTFAPSKGQPGSPMQTERSVCSGESVAHGESSYARFKPDVSEKAE